MKQPHPKPPLLSKERGLAPRYKDYEDLKKNLDISSAGREEANKIINGLKICDPAVGSGHFLVSCLNEIIAIKAELRILNYRDGRQIQNYSLEIENDELIIINEETDELFNYYLNPSGKPVTALQDMQEALFHEKETIIESCLFGVDINPNSVNICRLRLWIELLKNAYYTRESNYTELETLPNIDINIKQGNSLISRFKLDIDLRKALKTIKYTIEDYKTFVQGYRTSKNKEEKRNFTLFIEEIKKNFRHEISINDPRRKKLSNLAYELHNKFQTERLIDVELTEQAKKKLKAEEKKLEQEIEQKTKELEAEDKGELYRNAFEWRFEFPEVLDDEGNFKGFDVVIGNPPYIRAEDIKDFTKFFQNNYQVFTRGADIYFYFYELSYNILSEHGKHCFINNTYDKTTAGRTLRSFVTNNFSLIKYIDYTSVNVFEEATTYPVIILTEKSSEKDHFFFLKIESEANKFENEFYNTAEYLEIDQSSLNEQVWNFNVSKGIDILNKLLANTSIRDIYGKCYYGVKTALNEAFIIDETFELKYDILKKVYEGKDIKKWFTLGSDKIMIVIENGFTRNKFGKIDEENAFNKISKLYPEVFKHLLLFKAKAKKRFDKGEHWWELRNCAYYDLFEKSKIIFPNLQNENKFSWDESKSYINAPAVFLPTKDKFLLGILNSKLIWYFLKSICVVRNGGYIEVKPQYFEQIPIPRIDEKEKKSMTGLVDNIIGLKKQNLKADTTALEKELDEMVYKIYGLTEEEIRIVERNRD